MEIRKLCFPEWGWKGKLLYKRAYLPCVDCFYTGCSLKKGGGAFPKYFFFFFNQQQLRSCRYFGRKEFLELAHAKKERKGGQNSPAPCLL